MARKAKPRAKKTDTRERKLTQKQLKKLLESMRDEIIADLKQAMIEAEKDNVPKGGDLYDQASDDRARELSLSLSERDREKLMLIEEALNRVDMEHFHDCGSCGVTISPRRLKAIPYTDLCVDCAGKMEREFISERQRVIAADERAFRHVPTQFVTEEEG